MASGGDEARFQIIYGALEVNYDLAAATAGPVENLVAPKNANYQVFIQHIIVSVTTYAAKTMTFQDDAGTPVPIAFFSVPAAAPTGGGNQEYRVDFLGDGTPLTAGKNLDLVLSGAGVAGRIHISGYQKLVGPINANAGASLQ